MWNQFSKGQCCIRLYPVAVAMCATPPGTKDCDTVGGAFRPKRREGSREARGRSFPSSATITSHRLVSMRH
jgi:hypothetical protein